MSFLERAIKLHEKSWAFSSPSGGGAVFYIGGHYELVSGDNDFNPVVTSLGTANKSEAAHVFFVAASGATDTVITVTGISILDDGTRNGSASEQVAINNASVDTYYETTLKWLGSPSIEKTAGTDRLLNYGFVKYYDRNNTKFTVRGLEATWLAGASDSAIDMQVFHHKATGWAYNNGGTATPPTAIAILATDHSTDDETITGEHGAWKRDNLSTVVNGNNGEGIIIQITTTGANTFRIGNFNLLIKS